METGKCFCRQKIVLHALKPEPHAKLASNLVPNPQPRVQPNLMPRWQPSLQLSLQPFTVALVEHVQLFRVKYSC